MYLIPVMFESLPSTYITCFNNSTLHIYLEEFFSHGYLSSYDAVKMELKYNSVIVQFAMAIAPESETEDSWFESYQN
jgi:hypothetical protein